MPVLLMATVTHPSGKSSPLFSLRWSDFGVVSSIHNLCSGSVKTPTFGLVMVSTVVVVDILRKIRRSREGMLGYEGNKREEELQIRELTRTYYSYPTVH